MARYKQYGLGGSASLSGVGSLAIGSTYNHDLMQHCHVKWQQSVLRCNRSCHGRLNIILRMVKFGWLRVQH